MTTDGTSRDNVGVIVIHGVGDCEPGWISHYVVDRLSARCAALRPQEHSEAYQLDDRGRTNPGSFFPAYVRRASRGEGKPQVERVGHRVEHGRCGHIGLARVQGGGELNGVGAAACRIGHDKADDAIGPCLRLRRNAHQYG